MKVAELLQNINDRTIGMSDAIEAVQDRQIDQDKWRKNVDERIKKLSGNVTSLPGSNEGKDKVEGFFSKMIVGIATKDWRNIDDGEKVHDILIATKKAYKEKELKAGRALSTLIDSAGGYLVPAQYIAELIEELIANMVVMQAGARELPGLTGSPVQIPRKASGVTPNDQAENDTIIFDDQVFEEINMEPKMLTAGTLLSRRSAALSLPGLEDIVRSDLAEKLGLRADLRALRGSGASNQPLGIVNFPQIGSVALGTNGGEVSFDSLVDLEGQLEDANALRGKLSLIFHGKLRRKFAKLKDADGRPLFDRDRDASKNQPARTLYGYPWFVSNQLPTNLTKGTGTNLAEVIFGNFEDLLIGRWGEMLIESTIEGGDTFKNHQLGVKAVQEYDIHSRHDESFAVITDAKTAA